MKPPKRCRLRPLAGVVLAWIVSAVGGVGWAGGSGLNTVVVVNQNSPDSLALGNAYCELRGVPPQNVLRVTLWTGGRIEWTRAQYEACLLQPLLDMVASRGLTNQAEFVLLSMDIPYRVAEGNAGNSTTSALFYGFKTNTTSPIPGIPTCSLPPDSANSYAFSELPFSVAQPLTAPTNSFLTFMLTASNLVEAQTTLARGVASDSTFPTQSVILARTTDVARSVRHWEFDEGVFNVRVLGESRMVATNSNSTSFTNLLGLQTGLASLTMPTNAFVPGALGDSLTSYAGAIFENTGQTPLLAFLQAGAAGSYGTVTEPCNYVEKFPHSQVYFYQARGFSLAEAYYQSLRNPHQGLLVGDPLSAPFARRVTAQWLAPGDGAVLSGQSLVSLDFQASSTNRPVSRVDLYLDGTFLQTLTNIPPAPGNALSVTLNGFSVQDTVGSNATPASVAVALANALNAATNSTRVAAYPAGDRIELQSLDPATPGGMLGASAQTAIGIAPEQTTFLTLARTNLLDTTATGFLYLTTSNTITSGDWIQLQFTKTNGTVVTVSVTNTTFGSNYAAFVQSMVSAVNASPALQTADGVVAADFSALSDTSTEFFIHARTAGWPAAQIQVAGSASAGVVLTPEGTNRLESNLDDLRSRNHLYVSAGIAHLSLNCELDTTLLPDGFHTLTAVAVEGTSVQTQTRVSRSVRIQNTPLAATLTTVVGGTNTALEAILQFAVMANSNNIARAELFSTGGALGLVTNQSSASFSLAATNLGVGLHPFYAVVTDDLGQVCRTETQWLRIVRTETPFQLSLEAEPLAISWPALAGRSYDILATTNLADGFQVVDSLLATNTAGRWFVPDTNSGERWFRVRSAP